MTPRIVNVQGVKTPPKVPNPEALTVAPGVDSRWDAVKDVSERVEVHMPNWIS